MIRKQLKKQGKIFERTLHRNDQKAHGNLLPIINLQGHADQTHSDLPLLTHQKMFERKEVPRAVSLRVERTRWRRAGQWFVAETRPYSTTQHVPALVTHPPHLGEAQACSPQMLPAASFIRVQTGRRRSAIAPEQTRTSSHCGGTALSKDKAHMSQTLRQEEKERVCLGNQGEVRSDRNRWVTLRGCGWREACGQGLEGPVWGDADARSWLCGDEGVAFAGARTHWRWAQPVESMLYGGNVKQNLPEGTPLPPSVSPGKVPRWQPLARWEPAGARVVWRYSGCRKQNKVKCGLTGHLRVFAGKHRSAAGATLLCGRPL